MELQAGQGGKFSIPQIYAFSGSITILAGQKHRAHDDLNSNKMVIRTHDYGDRQVAEVVSDEIIIQSPQDALDLMGNLYYQGFDKIILHQRNLSPDFFDLQNGMAGEILQKFSNYRMQLAVIGDFSQYTRKSVKDFIHESNQSRQVNFVGTIAEALH